MVLFTETSLLLSPLAAGILDILFCSDYFVLYIVPIKCHVTILSGTFHFICSLCDMILAHLEQICFDLCEFLSCVCLVSFCYLIFLDTKFNLLKKVNIYYMVNKVPIFSECLSTIIALVLPFRFFKQCYMSSSFI